jgi:hypothetical protein
MVTKFGEILKRKHVPTAGQANAKIHKGDVMQEALPTASLSEKNKDIRSTKNASKIHRNRLPMLFR